MSPPPALPTPVGPALATAAAALVLLSPGLATAAELRVPDEYGSLSDAIEAAQPCDVILLAPGTYEGAWWLDKNVTIRGDGDASAVILDGDDFGNTIGLAQGARLENLTITGAARGIDMFGPWTEVGGVIFDGLEVALVASDATGRIYDSTFTNITETGIDANRSTLWIDDVTFTDVPVALEIIRSDGRLLRASTTGSDWGARIAQSTLDVLDSDLVDGGTGVFVQGGSTDVLGSRLRGNDLGVHVFDGDTTVLDNDLEDNAVGVLTTFATASVLGNRITGSTELGVHDGIGSASTVASNLLRDNVGGGFLQLADSAWRNNTVRGGSSGLVISGGSPSITSSIFTELDGTAIDASAALGTTTGFNLYWDVGGELLGPTPDGSDLTVDPALDADGVPAGGSPAIDAGDPTPGNEDPDGSRADIGFTGGPDADALWDPAPPGPPTFEPQEAYDVPEGWNTPIPIGAYGDPNGDPLRLTWDTDPAGGLEFCDGIGGAVDVAPPDDGLWPIRARIEDPDGNVAEVEIQVTAFNEPPEVWWEFESDPLESVETSFFVDVFDPAPLDTHLVDIVVDGVDVITGQEPGFITWTPATEGTFAITVRVTDDDGAVVDATQTVDVGPRPTTGLGSTDCDGCATAGGGASPAWALLAVVAWRRRRA